MFERLLEFKNEYDWKLNDEINHIELMLLKLKILQLRIELLLRRTDDIAINDVEVVEIHCVAEMNEFLL